jgi:3-mercaptopyruvate sulfurtransferase SseA
VQELKNNGFPNAAALLGGYAAWQAAGQPTEIPEPVKPEAAH